MKEEYLFPPSSCIYINDEDNNELLISYDRKLDLADTLMLPWDSNQRTVFIRIEISAPLQTSNDKKIIESIEHLIRYDLKFDGYDVELIRIDTVDTKSDTHAYRWKLVITV